MSGIANLEIFGLSELFKTFEGLHLAEMRNFLRKHPESSEILDNSANSGDCRTFQVVVFAEFQKFRIDLVFSEIGMIPAQAFDFRNDFLWPDADSLLLGSAGLVIE